MKEGMDDILKEFVGKKIGLSLGDSAYDEETDSTDDVLVYGILQDVRGRWAEIIVLKPDPYSLWINLDRVDYFSLKEPDFQLHRGKKVLSVQITGETSENSRPVETEKLEQKGKHRDRGE